MTKPHSSNARPPIPPKNVAWSRFGSTSAASPPAACWGGAGFCSNPRIMSGLSPGVSLLLRVLVVLDAEMRDLLLPHHPAQRVLELRLLNEEVMLGVEALRELRALEVEGEPLLNARQPGARGEIEEEREVEHDRGGENRVAAQKIDLDLHRIAEPSEDVDVVPPFLIISARWVVVDPNLVVDLAIQLRIELRLQDMLEQAELGLLLRLERLGIVQHFAVAVAEDVGGIPPRQTEHARLERGRQHALHHRLAGLEVLAADRHATLFRQTLHHRQVDRQVGRTLRERYG